MKRRELLGSLGLAALNWPVLAWAQSPQLRRIGYLMDRAAPGGPFEDGFLKGLKELGYEPGKTIAIEFRWTGGKTERLAGLVRELIDLKVELVVVAGAQSVQIAKQITSTIPIVMASSQDAVGDGLVASLAHPGGNVTGRSVYAPELTQKRIELLKETLPNLRSVAVLWNVHNAGGASQLHEAQKTGAALGIEIIPLDVQIPDGLENGMDRATRQGASAVMIVSDSSTISNRAPIGAAARQHGLATIFSNKAYLAGGGLMSYGPDIVDSFRLAAIHVDKILKGTKPSDLPVEQPTKFELAINLNTAKALHLIIPPGVLARADEVIE